MDASFQGFLGKNHSWSYVQHNIARQLIKKNFNIELVSTNGLEYFPEDLKKYLKYELLNKYDLQLTYTAPHNAGKYLRPERAKSSKMNRFYIWGTEMMIQKDFSKNHIFMDKILNISDFNRKLYLEAGFPEKKLFTIPHGINKEDFINLNKLPLKTKKTIKLCTSIAQPHLRKGIEDTLEAYCKAFTNKDDIVFILKVSTKSITSKFEVDVFAILKKIKAKYKNHPEIELIKDYIPNIYDLYNSCDGIFLLTKAEGFGLPYLEAMAAGKLVIAPRHGGQLEFLNDENSLMVEGKLERAPLNAQYWNPSPYASWFKSDIDSAVFQLRNFYNNYNKIKIEKEENMKNTVEKFTWDKQVDKIIGLIE